LCGLACRGRYRPVLLQFRFVLFLLAMWIATSLLFFWRYHFVLPGFGGCLPFLVIGLGMAVVSFAVLGPFLILSAASPFFRERLKVLLRVKEDAQT